MLQIYVFSYYLERYIPDYLQICGTFRKLIYSGEESLWVYGQLNCLLGLPKEKQSQFDFLISRWIIVRRAYPGTMIFKINRNIRKAG